MWYFLTDRRMRVSPSDWCTTHTVHPNKFICWQIFTKCIPGQIVITRDIFQTRVLYLLRRHHLIVGMGIPIINLRQLSDRLSFIIKILVPVRRCILVNRGPLVLVMADCGKQQMHITVTASNQMFFLYNELMYYGAIWVIRTIGDSNPALSISPYVAACGDSSTK